MKFTILLPHYKTFQMTAYTLRKLIEFKGKHEIEIIVIDNCPSDRSGKQLRELYPRVSFINYPEDKMQSHGIAFDYVIPIIQNEWFITIESDSFPTKDNWLDRYEAIIARGYDAAGSLLTLSGGRYMHPAGALYNKKVWEEASDYCRQIQYTYLPNMAMYENFPCHLMVSDRMFRDFCNNPAKYIILHDSYKNDTALAISEKAIKYEPVTKPFHNGMGQFNEAYSTYAARTDQTDPAGIILKNDTDFIYRMGYEPGQWLCYYMLATGKKLFYIPTKTKWMPGRENQQQEYTINDVGFKHLWGVSSYYKCETDGFQDITAFKAKQVEELYQSIQ